ncbi:MAG TPA: DUF4397 domain-containing protein [Gemmatimonadales bacterium]|nr:DUF4397 domain-containing protein [Gemmatimonadales bacterium]
MNLMRVGATIIIVAALAACKHEGGPFASTTPPTAGFRYVNLMPDRGAVDFRIVDAITFAPSAFGATFRTGGSPNGISTAYLPNYSPALTGTHRIRMFWTSTNPDTAQMVLIDTTITLSAGVNYTFYAYGYTTSGQAPVAKAFITTDSTPDPGTSIAFRAIHLAPAGSPTTAQDVPASVDVYVANQAVANPTGTATWAGVGVGMFTGYKTMAPDSLQVFVTPAGTPGTVTTKAQAPKGVAGSLTASPPTDPIAGTQQAGSSITAVIVPRSLAGSKAPQSAAYLVPTVLFLIDKIPPRITQ